MLHQWYDDKLVVCWTELKYVPLSTNVTRYKYLSQNFIMLSNVKILVRLREIIAGHERWPLGLTHWAQPGKNWNFKASTMQSNSNLHLPFGLWISVVSSGIIILSLFLREKSALRRSNWQHVRLLSHKHLKAFSLNSIVQYKLNPTKVMLSNTQWNQLTRANKGNMLLL